LKIGYRFPLFHDWAYLRFDDLLRWEDFWLDFIYDLGFIGVV